MSKLLLEKTWERIQKKTFTGWVNNHLRKVGMKIESLEDDLEDGISLIKLLEVISGETFPFRYDKKPRMRIQKAGNLGYALKFIADNGVRLVGIGPEDIMDKKTTLILGMIWTIILRWSIQDISMEDMSAKEGLLLWCQRKTKGYKDVNVQNFHFSWQDGLAFCALIHKHRPDLLDFDSLDKANKNENLQLAFDVAAKHLDIPQLIDPEDITEVAKPDERSIMTYVAMYFHVFSKGVEEETAARRIGNLLDFTRENDKAKTDYIEGATSLMDWIQQKIVEHDDRDFGDSIDDVTGKIGEFNNDYKKQEKPPKAQEKVELDSAFNQLNTRLAMNNRPAFTPPDGITPADIEAAWRDLEKHEHERQLALNEELLRQRKIQALLRRFDQYTEGLKRWATQREEFLTNDPTGTTLAEVSAQLRNHELFVSESEFMQNRLTNLGEIIEKLRALNYTSVDDLDERVQGINSQFDDVAKAAEGRKERLEAELARLQEIEDKLGDFAKRVKLLFMWLENEGDDVVNAPISDINLEQVQAQQAEFDEFANAQEEKAAEKDAVHALADELQALGVDENKYSEVSVADLDAKWDDVFGQIDERREAIAAEIERQENFEALRVDFAEKAQAAEDAIDEKKEAIASVTGEAEEMMESLRSLSSDIGALAPLVDAAGEVADQLEENGVTDNQHTTLTIEIVRRDYASLQKVIQEKLAAIEKEVLSKDASNISPEQLADYRQCFDHFDKDKSGSLDRLEFGALLKSLGQDVNMEEGGNLDEIWSELDADNSGTVTFDEFLGYMEGLLKDNDSPDEMKEMFKVIAGDKAFVTEADLRSVLNDDQVEYCLANMAPYEGVDGGYDYSTFTDDCYAR